MAIISRSAISQRFRDQIQESHQIGIEIQVLDGLTGAILRTIDTLQSGTVTVDASAAVRARCELEIADDGTLVPLLATDDLAPFGNEIRIARGITYADESSENVSLGVFRLKQVEPSESAEGITIRISGQDRWSRFVDARFEQPYSIAAGTNFRTAILDLAQEAWPDVPYSIAATDLTTPLITKVEGDDRGATLQDMATALGQEIYFDGDGILTMRPIAQSAQSPDWTISDGDGGVLVSAAKSWNADAVYNRVIASGESLDDSPPVQGVATDDNPLSPTNYFGEFGRRPRFFVSQMITTEAQAEDVAAGILAGALGTSQTVEFGAIVNPAMEPGESVLIQRERLGVNEIHVLDEVQTPLTAEEAMTGRTRIAEIEGT